MNLNWKYAALALAAVAGYLAYRHYLGPAAGTPGAVTGAKPAQSANALATAQLTVGAKALSEGAKEAALGPAKAAAREADKAQRKG